MPFNALNFTDLYDQGRQAGRRVAVQNALKNYETDPAQTQNALLSLGAFDEANQIGAARKDQTLRDVGTKFSNGDPAGAQAIALQNGNFDAAKFISSMGDDKKRQVLETIGETAQIGQTLKADFPIDPANPEAALQARKSQALKYANKFGIDPKEVAGWDFSDKALDDNYSHARSLGALQPDKLQEVSPGATLYNSRTHGAEFTAPSADKWQVVPEGGMLVNTAQAGTGSSASTGTPSGSPAQSENASVAGRNNNPGNLKWDGKSQWQGMTGVDGRGFVQFDSPENGARAADINLKTQMNRGPQTLTSFITRYAPASDHNDTAAYIASVAKQTGLDPNAPIPQDPAIQHKIPQAMFAVESGGTPVGPAVAPQGQPHSGVIMGKPKAMTRPATPQEKASYGVSPDTPMMIKPDGTPDVLSGAAATGSHEVISNGATGDELLKALDPATAAQVKAFADGRAQFPSGAALKSPYYQKMMGLVAQYDPNFDQLNYNARAATRKAFTSGQYSQNITSFNTALGHLDSLDKSIDTLHNSGFSWINGLKNAAWGANSAQASAALHTFEANKTAVMSELPRVFRGVGGAEADVQHWSKQINDSQSPEALHATVKAIADLIESRISSLSDTYSNGMGKASDAHEFLSPKANKVLEKLGVKDPSSFGGSHQQPVQQKQYSPQEAASLPAGTRFVGLDGVERVKH